MATTKQAERQQRMREKLFGARHRILGPIAPAPEPGTVFNPLPMFFDPGWMESLKAVVMARIRRSRVGCSGDIPAGYTRAQIRAGAENAAWEGFLDRFLSRDYARAGITETETARAVLSTLRIAEREYWRSPGDFRPGEREWYPYNRAQDSRTPDPRRVCHAARFSGEDTVALQGEGDDIPTGATVPVSGGNYRPMGNGKMIRVERETGCFTAAVILEGDNVRPTDTAEEYAVTETRWKMERRRGYVQSYPACEVDPGKPAARNRYQKSIPDMRAGGVENLTTARPMVPLPPVTRGEALENLRRIGRGYERGSADRIRYAQAIRRMRG